MPASLTLTPDTAGSLTLEPFVPLGGLSYLLQEDGTSFVELQDLSGFVLLEGTGKGLSLTPISPGSLTLTPIT